MLRPLPCSLPIDETAVLWITAPDHERGREGHSEDQLECQAERGVALCHRSSGGVPGELWPSSWGTALLGDFECMVIAPLFELLSISRNCQTTFSLPLDRAHDTGYFTRQGFNNLILLL